MELFILGSCKIKIRHVLGVQTTIRFKSQLNLNCKLNSCAFQVNLSVN